MSCPQELLNPDDGGIARVVQQVVPAVDDRGDAVDVVRGILELEPPALRVREGQFVLPHEVVLEDAGIADADVEDILRQKPGHARKAVRPVYVDPRVAAANGRRFVLVRGFGGLGIGHSVFVALRAGELLDDEVVRVLFLEADHVFLSSVLCP